MPKRRTKVGLNTAFEGKQVHPRDGLLVVRRNGKGMQHRIGYIGEEAATSKSCNRKCRIEIPCSIMPSTHFLGLVHDDYDAKQHSTDEQCHEGSGYHVATVSLILPPHPSSCLNIALLAVNVGFWAKDICNRLHERLARWRVDSCMLALVVVIVGLEFDIVVVLRYNRILIVVSTICPVH